MNNRLIGFLLMWVSLTGYAQLRPMTSAESDELQTVISETSKKTLTIQSRFEQKKHLSFLAKDMHSSGILIFKAPDRVKWEYKKPFLYSVVFKGNTLFINDEGVKSEVDVSSNKAFKSLNDMIVKSVNGDLFDQKSFSFEFFEDARAYEVHFLPRNKQMQQYVGKLILRFDKTQYFVTEIKMLEGDEDYTIIRFFDQQLNKPVDDAVFAN